MTMMMSQQRLLAATALSTVTASATSLIAVREIATAAGQDAVFKDAEARKIALSSLCCAIDMSDDSLYYLTAVNTDAADDGCRNASAIASQRSAVGSIQRKRGFENVFAMRRDMNSGWMNSSWAALVRLHPAA